MKMVLEEAEMALKSTAAESNLAAADELRIGERLAELRKAQDLTLAALAKSTSISEATLSRVENGRATLNAHNLYILARVLNTDVTAFFRSDTVSFSKGVRSLTRAGEGDHRATERYDYEILCADLAHKRMTPSRNRVTVRSLEEAGGLRTHEGEEFIHVLSGKVVIHSEFYSPALLEEGDSLYFDGNMGHAYVAADRQGAEILVVVNTAPSGG